MGDQSELDGLTGEIVSAGQERREVPESALVEFDAAERVTARQAPSSLAELAWMARALVSAVTLPKALQGKPGDILAVMLAGRELGIGPMAATRMVHIIQGQTSIATELKLALARPAGHEVVALAEGPGWCIVGCARHPEAGALGWCMEAGQGPEYPGLTGWTIAGEIMVESWEGERGDRHKAESPLVAKSNWRSYQRDMLFWRASSQFMRRHCPGLAGGLYTAEELGEGGRDE